MKKLLSLMIALLMIAVAVIPAYAADYGCDVSTTTDAVYMENLDTGNVVYEKNATDLVYPASTTKIMTFIIVEENVQDLSGTSVEIKEDLLSDLDPESSVMGLADHIGETVSVMDLLYGLMLPSGNDAALVLANLVGGSVSGFVDMMNIKAAQLSCENTHFTSPHGLFDERHYSTARDMAVITKYAMEKPDFMEICSQTRHTVTYSSSEEEIETTNYLIDNTQKGGYYYYPYAKGIKTGYTDEAGRCLVSTAEKDGYHYLLVALGAAYSYAEDINYAMLDSADLYDWAFDSISFQVVTDHNTALGTIPVKYAKDDAVVSIVPAQDVSALLPNGYDPSRVKTESDCPEELEAPVTEGDVCGTLKVYFDGELIGTTEIVASQSIEKDNFKYITSKIGDFIKDHVILTVAVLLVVFILIILLILSIRSRNRRKRRSRSRYR